MVEVAQPRRRSVDVGGLALALNDETRGHGWGGWEEAESGETEYAEVMIDVRAHTETVVNSEPAPMYTLSSLTTLPHGTRKRLIDSLGSWNFEPHKLPEEEVLSCAYILFEALYRMEGMDSAVGVTLDQLHKFLFQLQQLYRKPNSYHNFEHAIDVFQAVYYFMFVGGIVPSVRILLEQSHEGWRRAGTVGLLSCLSLTDIFAICIAAVGHDVGHPGLTNGFMKNAKSPLGVLYDDQSALERMHYSLMLGIMRNNGLDKLLDRDKHSATSFKRLLLMTVLATDLSVHDVFMSEFKHMVEHDLPEDVAFKKKVLVCQGLLKCADISNPGRPYTVSEHWAAALESEWGSQRLLENHLCVPSSVNPANDSLSQVKTQVFFISRFAGPLFQQTATAIPALENISRQCQENLQIWKSR
ncbi:hypothetical protein C8Q75DRAFT_714193, partial [Abortiporus biennis]